MLLPVILLTALASQTLSSPTNCDGACNDQPIGNFAQSRSASSSYSSSFRTSSLGNARSRISGSNRRAANLDNFDEQVNNLGSSDRPGNWNEEKHYITNDGRGQMSYKQGQIVSDAGITKYAQHNYRYNSQDSQAPSTDTQILSADEFDREMQRIKNSIGSFNRNFRFNSASLINENTEEDFRNQADWIRNKVSDICNQVSAESSEYSRMQEILRQFNDNVSRKEAAMHRFTAGNSHGNNQYTETPTYTVASTRNDHYNVEEEETNRRLAESLRSIQLTISNFYKQFNRLDTDSSYLREFNDRVTEINSRLANLQYDSAQNEGIRARVESLKTQFEKYTSQLRERIEEVTRKSVQHDIAPNYNQHYQEEHRRSQQYHGSHNVPSYNYEHVQESQRRVQEEVQRQSSRVPSYNRESQRRLQQETSSINRVPNYNTYERRNHEEVTSSSSAPYNHHQEETQRHVKEEVSHVSRVAPISVTQETETQVRIEQQVSRHGSRSRQRNQQGELQVQHLPAQTDSSWSQTQTVPSNIQRSSSSSSYSASNTAENSNSPYVDMTALTAKLQQDMHRIENEMNNFVSQYTMRMTETNTNTLGKDLNRMAENIKSNINNLCERTERFHTNNLHENAEELNRRFDETFKDFKKRIDNFHREKTSDAVAGVIDLGGPQKNILGKPQVTNVEFERQQTVEIETSRGAPKYSASASLSRRNYNDQQQVVQPVQNSQQSSHSSYQKTSSESRSEHRSYASRTGEVECVELYAGQPCVNQSTARFKRQSFPEGN